MLFSFLVAVCHLLIRRLVYSSCCRFIFGLRNPYFAKRSFTLFACRLARLTTNVLFFRVAICSRCHVCISSYPILSHFRTQPLLHFDRPRICTSANHVPHAYFVIIFRQCTTSQHSMWCYTSVYIQNTKQTSRQPTMRFGEARVYSPHYLLSAC